MNSISRMPPAPSFRLLGALAALHVAADQCLHLAQRFEHAEIQVAAIHEGPQHLLAQRVELGHPP